MNTEPKLTDASPEHIVKLDPGVVKVMGFGQIAAATDWAWLRSLVDTSWLPGKDRNNRSQFFYDLDLLTDLDPNFLQAPSMISPVVMEFGLDSNKHNNAALISGSVVAMVAPS